MKTLKIVLLATVTLVVVSLIFVSFSLGTIVKKGVETVAPQLLGVVVTVDNVDISLINGNAQISGLSVGNPKGFKSDRAFYLGQVKLQLEPLSLLSNTIIVRDITITKPEITYELASGQTNIGMLKQNIASPTPDATAKQPNTNATPDSASGKHVVIDHLLISDAAVNANIAGLSKSITLPSITLRNIGSDDKPSTIANAANAALSAVIKALAQVDLGSLAGELGNKGKAITDGIKDVGDKIKGLFK